MSSSDESGAESDLLTSTRSQRPLRAFRKCSLRDLLRFLRLLRTPIFYFFSSTEALITLDPTPPDLLESKKIFDVAAKEADALVDLPFAASRGVEIVDASLVGVSFAPPPGLLLSHTSPLSDSILLGRSTAMGTSSSFAALPSRRDGISPVTEAPTGVSRFSRDSSASCESQQHYLGSGLCFLL